MAITADKLVLRMSAVALRTIKFSQMIGVHIVGLHILGAFGKLLIITVTGLAFCRIRRLIGRIFSMTPRTGNSFCLMRFSQRCSSSAR